MVKHVVNVLVVANSSEHSNNDFRHTRSELDNNWVRHIMSPSSALSSPKKHLNSSRLLVQWRSRMTHDSCKSWQRTKSWRWILLMHLQTYVEARAETIWADETISRGSAIAETDFTIMSMPSLVYAWFLFIMYLCSFIIASFPCALQNCDNKH